MSKLMVEVSDEMTSLLDGLAIRRGLSSTQILRRAVGLMKFLDDQIDAGNDLVLRNRDTYQTIRLELETRR